MAAETPRPARWLVLNAVLWLAVGVGGTLAAQRFRPAPPALADLADQACARLEGLELDAGQAAALERLRADWRAAILGEERSFLDRLDRAAADADARVEALLRADQRERYRQLAVSADAK